MKSDIQIAQEAKMKNIREIAVELNLSEDDIDQYGKYKCKISLDVLERNKDNKKGKLVLVTAINPTPAGEGKSTVTPQGRSHKDSDKQRQRCDNNHRQREPERDDAGLQSNNSDISCRRQDGRQDRSYRSYEDAIRRSHFRR